MRKDASQVEDKITTKKKESRIKRKNTKKEGTGSAVDREKKEVTTKREGEEWKGQIALGR